MLSGLRLPMSLDFHILYAFSFLGDVGFWRDWDSKEPLFLGLGKKGVDRSFCVMVCSR